MKVEKKCTNCGSKFETESYECYGIFLSKEWCDKCNEGRSDTFALGVEEDKAIAMSHWKKHTPLIYQKTDVSRLPKKQYEEIISWKYNPIGLGAIGKTGTCKTRCMWILIQNNCGFEYKTLTATEFAHECSRLYATDLNAAEAWIKSICSCKLLFIDDIGKERMTERVATELYYVVEKRTSNELPILWTSNFVGEQLEEKLGESGAATVRRLREFSKIVSFV